MKPALPAIAFVVVATALLGVGIVTAASAETQDPPDRRPTDGAQVDSLDSTDKADFEADGDSGGVRVTRGTETSGRSGRSSSGGGSGSTTDRARSIWNQYCLYSTTRAGTTRYTEGATTELTYLRSSETEGNGIYRADCTTGGPTPTSFNGGTFDLPGAAGLAPVDPLALRDEAAARIQISPPNIDTNPSFTDRFAVVRIETWLWVTDPWIERTEGESDGGLSVSVVARPTNVTWQFDEPDGPGLVSCDGPGTPWTRTAPQTACGYTFTTSSAGNGPDNAFTASATIEWEFTWSLDGIGQGIFNVTTATTPFTIQVGEIQAVGAPNRNT